MQTSKTPARSILLLLAIGVGGTALHAQDATDPGTLSGRVVDAATGDPVWGAFVGLAPATEGVFTDSLGTFRLEVSRARSYEVTAERLGYSSSDVLVSAEDLGAPVVIRVEPDPVALEQIEIVETRFERERNAHAGAVSVLDEETLLRQVGQTAFDVLQRRLALRPCAGGSGTEWCTSSRGALVPPRVYIDERPVMWSGLDWLRDYEAREIFLMEIYDFGRTVRVLTRWEVEENPERLAALRRLPIVPEPWWRMRSP